MISEIFYNTNYFIFYFYYKQNNIFNLNYVSTSISTKKNPKYLITKQ